MSYIYFLLYIFILYMYTYAICARRHIYFIFTLISYMLHKFIFRVCLCVCVRDKYQTGRTTSGYCHSGLA